VSSQTAPPSLKRGFSLFFATRKADFHTKKSPMRAFILLAFFALAFSLTASAQSRRNDIPVKELPSAVKQVLENYVDMLRSSSDLETCASRFTKLAGGSLVNEDGASLRASVKPYSLKKDHQNVRFYAQPLKITRVNVQPSRSSGYGESAIRGKTYKIWIAKAEGQPGMPAPISILVPEGHPEIKSPKVIGIGSL